MVEFRSKGGSVIEARKKDRTIQYLIDMIRQLDDRKLRLVYTFVLHLLK